MYLNFYELRKEPFSLAPDPDFLYLSQQHKDALGAIIYGIRAKQGFVSVVGEVGTGKTTIVRTYLQKAGRDKLLPIFIFNSRITFTELMDTFLREIGIKDDEISRLQTVNEMVTVAHRAMLEKNKQGNTIVLIIDEAQNMPIDTLAKLCILSNFETTKAKLIQIILVGQPELQEKLALQELRQLRQRIAYRALITPLSAQDSVSYLNHRLSLVAKVSKPLFTPRAIKKIVDYSKGVPRVINILCENSLVAGYGLQKKPVSLRIVKQVIAEHEGIHQPSPQPLRAKLAVIGALMLVLAAISIAFYLPHLGFDKDIYGRLVSLVNASVSQPEAATGEAGGHSDASQRGSVEDKAPQEEATAAKVPSTHAPASSYQANIMSLPRFWETFTLDPHSELSNELLPGEVPQSLSHQGLPAALPTVGQGFESGQLPHLKIAKKGDTVSSLCQSTYGFVNDRVLRWIKSYNPHISNLDEIRVNEIIFFPEMNKPGYFKGPSSSVDFTNTAAEEIVTR